ncbi:MAG TPA: tetratricopeptide repeat protein, partial [Bryobacteraceae bacterium]|nr:tetratricopeptide repeat protein [Bryobacteraceae bacterium]
WISKRSVGLMALGCGVLSVIAFSIATTDKIVVGPFSVPKEYEDRGYTSEAMSSAVVQFIHGHESTVSLTQPKHLLATDQPNATLSADGGDEMEDTSESIDGKHVVSSFDQSNVPDIKIPLTSFSLETLANLLRDTVGRRSTQIAGEIVSLNEADSSAGAEADPQHTMVLIRYKIEYPEPSYPILGYHWWPRRTATVTGTLTANGAEEVVRKLALITADGLGRRTLIHEDKQSRIRRLIARGNAYFGLNDFGRAARMYELANTLEKSGHAYLCMGVIEENEGNYAQAEGFYRQATEVPHDKGDNDAAWAMLYWGNLLLREHHPAEAIAKFLSIASLPPNINTLLVQGAVHNNLGFVNLYRRNWKQAEASFRSAELILQQLHESAQICAYSDGESSTCEHAQTELQRADNKTEAYLSIDSTNHLLALTHYGLARTFLQRGTIDFAEVRREYRESIQADPSYSRAHYQLARIYISQKSYKDAQDELQKTIQLESGFEQAYADWKGLIDRWPHLADKHKSDKPLNRALARDYRNLGDSFIRAGNPDDAIERYCAAASLDNAYKGLCAGQQTETITTQRSDAGPLGNMAALN